MLVESRSTRITLLAEQVVEVRMLVRMCNHCSGLARIGLCGDISTMGNKKRTQCTIAVLGRIVKRTKVLLLWLIDICPCVE
jgi:recombinational DNA repair protein RecR